MPRILRFWERNLLAAKNEWHISKQQEIQILYSIFLLVWLLAVWPDLAKFHQLVEIWNIHLVVKSSYESQESQKTKYYTFKLSRGLKTNKFMLGRKIGWWLAQRFLPMPEVHSLNPVISNFFIEHINCWYDKNIGKRGRGWAIKNRRKDLWAVWLDAEIHVAFTIQSECFFPQ